MKIELEYSQEPAVGVEPQQDDGRTISILDPGHNCLNLTRADKAKLLIDAEAYFTCLDECLRRAERSITIIGWDFDARVCLHHRDRDGADGETLGDLLRQLVEASPELEVRILVWSVAVLHTPSDPKPLLFGAEWQKHPRIHLHLATDHPAYACHHQKIVVVDDVLAFTGGIDLTVERWDTSEHAPDDPRRQKPDGTGYHPVHDCQMMIEGPLAREIAEVARQRWRSAMGETLPAPDVSAPRWPVGHRPDFVDTAAGVALTAPRWRGAPGLNHSSRLTTDALLAARRFIYIETQYFSSRLMRPVLSHVLSQPDGPEVLVVTSLTLNGWIERVALGNNRDRLIRALRRKDGFGRLRVCHAATVRDEAVHEIFLHSKLIVVDDVFLRIGSANLSNRSIGLDTECDIGFEAENAVTRQAIANVRNRLLAEHLGSDAETVRATIAAEGSLLKAVDRLTIGERQLRPLAAMDDDGPVRSVPGTRFLDPVAPFGSAGWWWPK
ncbi:phospholipase D-like domain-containing protein [Consotaella aegiceratis]|uniref:phospholipase D-like domain-containing protein n=1 Tax=Consotaella aegiceratis TaxID=3097961 RepID=UPI002F3F6CC7